MTACRLYRATFARDHLEYWKAPDENDLKAWLHDEYAMTLPQVLGLEIDQILLTEAESINVAAADCGRYTDLSLLQLFRHADDGCVRLATL